MYLVQNRKLLSLSRNEFERARCRFWNLESKIKFVLTGWHLISPKFEQSLIQLPNQEWPYLLCRIIAHRSSVNPFIIVTESAIRLVVLFLLRRLKLELFACTKFSELWVSLRQRINLKIVFCVFDCPLLLLSDFIDNLFLSGDELILDLRVLPVNLR